MRPPVVLTFLAPAERCNQRCPQCIIDQVGEPVTRFQLEPRDFARFLEQFVKAGVPILSVNFQGYEVTLPKSWPYLEAVFRVGQAHDIRRAFITNGMLLAKWTGPIEALDPYLIGVSLDGASPEINDPRRGLPGAFATTVRSLRTFLRDAPQFRNRIQVTSCVYGEAEYRSLLAMPPLLRSLGIKRWTLSGPLIVEGGIATMAQPRETLVRWFAALREAAASEDLVFFVADEFGFFEGDERDLVGARTVFDANYLYRVDPLGNVHIGREVLQEWSERPNRVWDPREDDAVTVCGYPDQRTVSREPT